MFRWLTSLIVTLLVLSPNFASEFLGRNRYEWTKDLSSSKPMVRRSAAFALGKLGSFALASVPKLSECLKDDHVAVREMAAHALGEIARASLLDARTIWNHAGDGLLAILKESSTSGNANLQRSAAYALGCCGTFAQSAEPMLIQVLRESKSPAVRQNAAWALGRLESKRNDKIVQALCDTLEKRDEAAPVLRDAALALQNLGASSVKMGTRSLLNLLLRKPDVSVIRPALNTLTELVKPGEKIDTLGLEYLLSHEEAEIRLAAAFVMVASGNNFRTILPVLLEQLRNGSVEKKELVIATLANLGPLAEPAVPDLIKVLNDNNLSIKTRRNAAVALSRIGKEADAAVKSLAVILDPRAKEPLELRMYVAEALYKIGHPGNEPAKEQMLRALANKAEHPELRLRMVWAMNDVPDLVQYGAVKPLTDIIDESEKEYRNVRFNTAVLLGVRLGPEVPIKVVGVLNELLNQDGWLIYEHLESSVSGSNETSKGGSDVKAKLGRDGRFLAAHALRIIGTEKASRPEVIQSLKKLADTSKDDRVVKACNDALKVLE